MHHVGVDIIEIPRIRQALDRWGERFLRRIYTPGEAAYCRNRAPQLAARFAAKEAVMKALGTGIRGVGWREIEVVRERGQAPSIRLHGRAQKRASDLKLTGLAISISHSRDYAVVMVVGETAP
ncbi:MAG: holo-ACP synthase [Dehalococcoidia bacterium]|nr:holo-ACP synthase [Dehalococcoidia bacterium]